MTEFGGAPLNSVTKARASVAVPWRGPRSTQGGCGGGILDGGDLSRWNQEAEK